MTLMIDFNTLIKLFFELLKQVINNKWMIQLIRNNKKLIKKFKKKYDFIKHTFSNHSWIQVIKQINVILHWKKNNWKNRLFEKTRKRYFWNVNIDIFKIQFVNSFFFVINDDVKSLNFFCYDIFEWGFIVRLICKTMAEMMNHEKHNQKLKTLRARILLCERQKNWHHIQSQSTQSSIHSMTLMKSLSDSEKNNNNRFFLICKPTQCIFCLGNERKSHED